MLSDASEAKLRGVHPDLVKVIREVSNTGKVKFIVTEGVRTLARQKELFRDGKSKTMNSRHLVAGNGYSHAVDVAVYKDGKVCWDFPLYEELAQAVKAQAKLMKIGIVWGGDWEKFRDGCHFELSRGLYP